MATTNCDEAGIGSFCYYLALVGGFNYISKEVEQDHDEPVSFYNIDVAEENENMKMFLEDLAVLAGRERAWAIMPLSCSSTRERKLHFVHNTSDNLPACETVRDDKPFRELYGDVRESMDKEFSIKVGEHEDYTLTTRNIAYRLAGHVNSFSLRVSYDITCWDDKRMDKISVLASLINKHLSGRNEMPVAMELQETGFGYKE